MMNNIIHVTREIGVTVSGEENQTIKKSLTCQIELCRLITKKPFEAGYLTASDLKDMIVAALPANLAGKTEIRIY